MKKLTDVFAQCKTENRAALVGYLPAGFPDQVGSIEAVKCLITSGCDIIEIGLPYSDPVMDGPVIQAAAEQALSNGTKIAQVLETVAAVAELAPTLVMTYWNPVVKYGVSRFAADLKAAGGVGLITPDLTPDYAEDWLTAAQETNLAKVFLVSPSSTAERLRMTAENSSGFIYATAVMGVTGAREDAPSMAPELVARLKEITRLPIGVGLGVSTRAQAAEVAEYADAVIVGSALVKTLLASSDLQTGLAKLAELTAELAAGVRGEA